MLRMLPTVGPCCFDLRRDPCHMMRAGVQLPVDYTISQ
jgi:hypothetical protein